MDVYIYNVSDDIFEEMVIYCIDNDIELVKFEHVNESYWDRWESIVRFSFVNEEDALFFKLKFKCQ